VNARPGLFQFKFSAVFFIAKPDLVPSIPAMIQRLILIAVSSLLALAMTSCCCLFS
jgi:hypothetical protein